MIYHCKQTMIPLIKQIIETLNYNDIKKPFIFKYLEFFLPTSRCRSKFVQIRQRCANLCNCPRLQ